MSDIPTGSCKVSVSLEVQNELNHFLTTRSQCCLSNSWMLMEFQIPAVWPPWLTPRLHICLVGFKTPLSLDVFHI